LTADVISQVKLGQAKHSIQYALYTVCQFTQFTTTSLAGSLLLKKH